MDMESGKGQLIPYIKKFRYFLIMLIVGVLVMLIPDGEPVQPEVVSSEVSVQPDLEKELEDKSEGKEEA